MVLGKWHIGALRKVQEQGPIKRGIHPCISGLASDGFADKTDEGYILTEKGEIALKVYDDMDTKHRELLMRIYSAKKSGHKFPIASAGDELSDILDLDLIEVYDNDFLRLTKTGIQFWETHIEAYSYTDPDRKGTWNQSKSKATRARKKESPSPSGSEASAMGRDLGRGSDTDETPEPRVYQQGVKDGCETCINKQVLDMIAAKHPEVAELRDILLRQQQLMNKLNLD